MRPRRQTDTARAMSRAALLLAAAVLAGPLLAGGAALAQEPSFPAPTEPRPVPGQFIVKFQPGLELATTARLLELQQAEIVDTLPLIGAQVISLPPDGALERARALPADIPGVLYVEPVYEVFAVRDPNDPRYREQWGFPRIKAPDAWNRATDASGIVVAVIDSGVDYRHPDLAANMWRNPNEIPGNGVDDDRNGVVDDVHGASFIDPATSGDPTDDNGHGTHVAGTIGAVTDNALSVAGVNWTAEIMALKFLNGSGRGTTAGAIRAIEYAIAHDVRIMNNSWGGGGFSRALEEAIRAASDEGILFVAAAGNANNDNDANPFYPAGYDLPNVVSVMATDQSDARAGFSNFGATTVDLAAPGVGILSTVPGGGEQSFNGTSMASPHVAGAAALVLAVEPDLAMAELKARLLDTAEIVPGLSGRSVTGARLDLAAALGEAEPPGPGPGPGPGDPCGAEAPRFAHEEFHWSDGKSVDAHANLLSVTFSLPTEMVVDVSVNGSARRTGGSGTTTFRTGVFDQAAPNVMWTGSYRRGSVTAADVAVPVVSDFAIRLPAGEHTIWWKFWVTGATFRFDSGTLVARAFPCTMGGRLAAAADGGGRGTATTEAGGGAAMRERTSTGKGGVGVTVADRGWPTGGLAGSPATADLVGTGAGATRAGGRRRQREPAPRDPEPFDGERPFGGARPRARARGRGRSGGHDLRHGRRPGRDPDPARPGARRGEAAHARDGPAREERRGRPAARPLRGRSRAGGDRSHQRAPRGRGGQPDDGRAARARGSAVRGGDGGHRGGLPGDRRRPLRGTAAGLPGAARGVTGPRAPGRGAGQQSEQGRRPTEPRAPGRGAGSASFLCPWRRSSRSTRGSRAAGQICRVSRERNGSPPFAVARGTLYALHRWRGVEQPGSSSGS